MNTRLSRPDRPFPALAGPSLFTDPIAFTLRYGLVLKPHHSRVRCQSVCRLSAGNASVRSKGNACTESSSQWGLWPSGLRRQLKVSPTDSLVRKGVGSNPTGLICFLPLSVATAGLLWGEGRRRGETFARRCSLPFSRAVELPEIGRASCRERVS